MLVCVGREDCRCHFARTFRKGFFGEFVLFANAFGRFFFGSVVVGIHSKLRRIICAFYFRLYFLFGHRRNDVCAHTAREFFAVFFAFAHDGHDKFVRVFYSSRVKLMLDEEKFGGFFFDFVYSPTVYAAFGEDFLYFFNHISAPYPSLMRAFIYGPPSETFTHSL